MVLEIVVIVLVVLLGLWCSTIYGLFVISMQFKQVKLFQVDRLFYRYLMSEGRVQFRNWLKRNNYIK